jgi:DNA-binding response OmpR family regulator
MDRRPRLLVVYTDSVYAVHCSRFFRRRGWDVHLAASGDEACELIGSLVPTAVVVDGELPEENAREICARITREHPGLTVVIATPDGTGPADRGPAGAVVIPRRQGVEGLAEHLFGVACA